MENNGEVGEDEEPRGGRRKGEKKFLFIVDVERNKQSVGIGLSIAEKNTFLFL